MAKERKSPKEIDFIRKLNISSVVTDRDVKDMKRTDYSMKQKGFEFFKSKGMWIHCIRFSKLHKIYNRKCQCSICRKAEELLNDN